MLSRDRIEDTVQACIESGGSDGLIVTEAEASELCQRWRTLTPPMTQRGSSCCTKRVPIAARSPLLLVSAETNLPDVLIVRDFHRAFKITPLTPYHLAVPSIYLAISRSLSALLNPATTVRRSVYAIVVSTPCAPLGRKGCAYVLETGYPIDAARVADRPRAVRSSRSRREFASWTTRWLISSASR